MRKHSFLKSLIGLTCFSLLPNLLVALPQSPEVISGEVVFSSQNDHVMTIEASDKSIINYQSFNIGSSERVQFIQPCSASTVLNRVEGNNGSEILGSLQSNGKIFLVNPHGVYFGPNAKVDTGSLIVSTLDMINQDFNQGRFYFYSKEGTTPGLIHIQGNLSSPSGVIALISPYIKNEGSITATEGKVLLASAEAVTLNFSGDGLMSFVVEGEAKEALIEHSGTILASGGEVFISLKTAHQAINNVINTDGLVEGNSIVQENGTIRIVKQSSIKAENVFIEGSTTSQVAIEGEIDVSDYASNKTGGTLHILGDHINLKGALIDASGDIGGGTILIGGDYKGEGSVKNALTNTTDQDSLIKANAITEGNGGKVILWADEDTLFNGTILARGGEISGNGGFVETSGKINLGVQMGRVNTLAPHGKAGTWLLDPTAITIMAVTEPGTLVGAATCTTAGANPYLIQNTTINAATSNVILCATAGPITLSSGAPISMTYEQVGISFQSSSSTIISTVLNDSITTLDGNIDFFNTNVTLGGTSTLTAGFGNIFFGGTVDGAQNFTVSASGTKTFTGAVGSTTPLTSLTSNGSGTLSLANVSTTAAQTYNDTSVILNGTAYNTTFSSGNGAFLIGVGNVNFTSAKATAVTITTGTGAITVGGIVTGWVALTLSSSGPTAFNSTIGGVNGASIEEYVPTSLTTGTGTLSLQDVTTAGAQNYTSNSAVTLNGYYSTRGHAGTVSANFSVTNPTTLGAITNISTGSGAISLGTVNGAFDLTLTGTGTKTLGVIGASFPPTSFTSLGAGTLSLAAVTTAGAQTYNTDTAITLSGTTYSTRGSGSGNANFSATGAVTLGNATIGILTGSGSIYFGGTLNGTSAFTATSTGSKTFSGIIGGTTPLTSFTSSAAGTLSLLSMTTAGIQTSTNDTAITLNGTYSTGGSSNFTIGASGVVTLGGTTNVVAGSGSISFGNTVDGNYNLTVTASGTKTFSNAVGSLINLDNFTSNGGAGTLILNSVTTAGSQFYNTDTAITLNGAYSTQGNSGAGNANFSATGSGTITLGGATTITTGSGSIIVASPITGTQILTITGTGTKTFSGTIGASPLSSFTSNGAGTLSLATVTTSGAQTYNDTAVTLNGPSYTTTSSLFSIPVGAVTLGGTTGITTGSGNIFFGSTIDGTQALTVTGTGTKTFKGTIGGITPLASILSSSAGTLILNSVTTTGAQSYNDTTVTLSGTHTTTNANFSIVSASSAVTLSGETTVSTGTGSITFGGTLNGDFDLAVSGAGTKTFTGVVGGTTPLASLTSLGAGTLSLANVTTINAQTYNYDTAVTLNGTYTTTNAPFSVIGTVTLAGTSVTTSILTGNGNISFGSTINATGAGSQSLSVSSTGAKTFLGAIGGSTYPGTLTSLGPGTLSLQSVTTGGAQTYNFDTIVALNGTTYSTMGAGATNGAFSISVGNVNFGAARSTAVSVSTGTGSITFGGTVTGWVALTVTSNTPGVTTFGSTIGGINGAALEELVPTLFTSLGTGPLSLQDVTTGGAQTYNSNSTVSLNGYYSTRGHAGTTNANFSVTNPATLADTTSISTGSGSISLGTVNGAHDLTVSGTGTKTLGVIGLSSAPTSFTSLGAGTLSLVNVTTIGAQSYSDAFVTLNGTYTTTASLFSASGAVTLGGATNIVTNGGAITFGGTLNGGSTFIANSTGAKTFSGIIGGTTPLTSFTSSGAGTLSLLSMTTTGLQTSSADTAVTLNGTYTTTASLFSASGAVTLGGATSIVTNGGTITFGSTVDGNFDLTVNSTALKTFTGSVGSFIALENFTSLGAGSLLLHPVTTAGSQFYNTDTAITLNGAYSTQGNSGAGNANFSATGTGTITLGSATTITAGSGSITVASPITGTQILTITGTGTKTFSGTIGASPLSSFTSNGAGTLSLARVTTSGAQTYNDTSVTLNGPSYTTTSSLFSIPVGAVTLGGTTGITTGSGNIFFGSTIDGTQALTVTGTGTKTFSGTIGGITPLASILSSSAGTLILNSVTTTGAQSYNDTTVTLSGTHTTTNANFSIVSGSSAVTLSGETTVSTGTGSITFGGTIDGSFDLVVSATTPGTKTFTGVVGGTTPLLSLTGYGTGSPTLNSVTTINAQHYNYGASVTLNGSTYSTINAPFSAVGPVTLGGTTTSITTGTGNITFGSTINATVAGTQSLSVTSTGAKTFSGDIGGSFYPGTLTSLGAGTLSLQSVTTGGTQTYDIDTAVALNGTTYSTRGAGAGNANFSIAIGAVTLGAAKGASVGISTGSGSINIGSTVKGWVNLTVTSSGAKTFGSTIGGINGGVFESDVPLSFTSLETGTLSLQDVTTGGAQTYLTDTLVTLNGDYSTRGHASTVDANFEVGGPALFAASSNIQTGAGTLSFAGSVDSTGGNWDITVTGTGAKTFSGAIGGTTPPESFSSFGLGALSLLNVTTLGGQSYGDATIALNGSTYTTTNGSFSTSGAVTLAGTTGVSTGSGSITFGSTLDGRGSPTVTISGGDISFNGEVGGVSALGNCTVTPTTDLTINNAFTAGSFTQSGTGTSTIAGSLNTSNSTGVSLTGTSLSITSPITTTGSGPVAFVNSDLLTLSNKITSNGSISQSGGGNVSLGSTLITTNSTAGSAGVSFTNPVTLSNSTFVNTSTGAGTISFNGTIDGTENLSLAARTGAITLSGSVGAVEPVNTFTVYSAGNLSLPIINASSLMQSSGTGTTTLNGAVTTTGLSGVTLVGSILNINAPITTLGGGPVTFQNSGALTTSSSATIKASGPIKQSGTGTTSISGNITNH